MARIAHRQPYPIFQQDFTEYMLEAPRRRPRFDWLLLAIVAGTIFGALVIVLSKFIF